MPERAEGIELDVVTVEAVIAAIEAVRDRYWHSKAVGGERVRDEKATKECLHCSGGHRALDDVLYKLRPTVERHRAAVVAASRAHQCCDVCTP